MTIDELIGELLNFAGEYGGDIRVVLPQAAGDDDNPRLWNANISSVDMDMDDSGNRIVVIA